MYDVLEKTPVDGRNRNLHLHTLIRDEYTEELQGEVVKKAVLLASIWTK